MLAETLARIGSLDEAAMTAARRRLDSLTKPPGSLGRLESLAVQLAGITGSVPPTVEHRVVYIFAADHGVTAERVSAYPAAVTRQMVANFLHGGAAINVRSRDRPVLGWSSSMWALQETLITIRNSSHARLPAEHGILPASPR